VSAATARLYTDPACPPDPEWLRLLWQHGDRVATELRMIVLREHRSGDWGVPGSDATIHACRAVVAAGLRWPDRQIELLRHLRVLSAAGEMLDDSDTLEIAAERAGLPVAEIAAYCAEPEVESALQAQRGGECGTVEVDGALAAPRPPASSPAEVLEWAGVPLTIEEIAAVCARDVDEFELAGVAHGAHGYWVGAGHSRFARTGTRERA
jgi:hypothetical protein